MRTPSLTGLRAFEATARHLSMKQAADELCVTPSAVSQLVRGLEEELGLALFRRVHRALRLTDAGQTLLPGVRGAFELIAVTTERVRRATADGVLTVSATPFFAETWLVPRLGDFGARHPEIDLRITATAALVDLAAGEADVAIRHGLGRYRGMRSDLLVAPAVVPVAAPALVARLGRPSDAAGLLDWPKVHDADRGAWAAWFARHGVVAPERARGPSFDDAGLLRAAVVGGQGVGLLPHPLVVGDIAEGRLVALAKPVEVDAIAYYLVAPELVVDRPKIAAFRAWALAAR
jgi:LysR family glycine cleavage system transcriptional activator